MVQNGPFLVIFGQKFLYEAVTFGQNGQKWAKFWSFFGLFVTFWPKVGGRSAIFFSAFGQKAGAAEAIFFRSVFGPFSRQRRRFFGELVFCGFGEFEISKETQRFFVVFSIFLFFSFFCSFFVFFKKT